MRDHTLRRFDGLTSKLNHLKQRGAVLASRRDSLIREKDHLEAEVVRLSSRALLLGQVGELYRLLLDRMVLSQASNMASMVTEALQAVFPGLDLTLKAQMGARAGKVTLDFILSRVDHEGDPLDTFGGGPTSLVSLLLRVLLLLKTGRAKLLFLDESLAAVADIYVEGTSRFLAALAESTGTTLVLITHKKAFGDEADMRYQATEVANPRPHLHIKGL